MFWKVMLPLYVWPSMIVFGMSAPTTLALAMVSSNTAAVTLTAAYPAVPNPVTDELAFWAMVKPTTYVPVLVGVAVKFQVYDSPGDTVRPAGKAYSG
jgi:hypothetical protein